MQIETVRRTALARAAADVAPEPDPDAPPAGDPNVEPLDLPSITRPELPIVKLPRAESCKVSAVTDCWPLSMHVSNLPSNYCDGDDLTAKARARGWLVGTVPAR